MRERPQHLFFDTIRSSEPAIASEALDCHLETLTRLKQEYQFEPFRTLVRRKGTVSQSAAPDRTTGGLNRRR